MKNAQCHQSLENANQDHSELPLNTHWGGYNNSHTKQPECVHEWEKLEPLYVAGRNIDGSATVEKQVGGSRKS